MNDNYIQFVAGRKLLGCIIVAKVRKQFRKELFVCKTPSDRDLAPVAELLPVVSGHEQIGEQSAMTRRIVNVNQGNNRVGSAPAELFNTMSKIPHSISV